MTRLTNPHEMTYAGEVIESMARVRPCDYHKLWDANRLIFTPEAQVQLAGLIGTLLGISASTDNATVDLARKTAHRLHEKFWYLSQYGGEIEAGNGRRPFPAYKVVVDWASDNYDFSIYWRKAVKPTELQAMFEAACQTPAFSGAIKSKFTTELRQAIKIANGIDEQLTETRFGVAAGEFDASMLYRQSTFGAMVCEIAQEPGFQGLPLGWGIHT